MLPCLGLIQHGYVTLTSDRYSYLAVAAVVVPFLGRKAQASLSSATDDAPRLRWPLHMRRAARLRQGGRAACALGAEGAGFVAAAVPVVALLDLTGYSSVVVVCVMSDRVCVSCVNRTEAKSAVSLGANVCKSHEDAHARRHTRARY